MVKKKKTGNNYVTKKSGSKNTSVRRVKKSTRGRRMVRKHIFFDGVQLGSSCVDFIEHPNF